VTLKRKYFSQLKTINLPNLIENQIRSFEWFIKQGIKEVFNEVSPIRSYNNNLELYFLDYYFDAPKYDEQTSRYKNITFDAPLRCKVKLCDKKNQKNIEQEVYLGDFPIITNRGTFIINGIERVVVSQLIRSPGVFFTNKGAKIVPHRGAWLEIEADSEGVIWVRIDRKRKVAITSLLRVFGYESNQELVNLFGDSIKPTLKKDNAKNQDQGLIEVYRRIRPGDLATVDNARSMIENMFFNAERYDLGKVGRYMFNRRLNIKNINTRILRNKDLLLVVKEILKRGDSPADDIDHLGNRRIRTVGELVQNRFRIGLARMSRNIRDKMSTIDIADIVLAQLINARPLTASVREFFASSQLSQFMDQVNSLAELEHKRRLSAMGPGGLTRDRASFEVRDVHSSHYGRICPIQSSEGPNIGLVVYLSNYARINEYGFLETPYRKVVKGKITNQIVYLNAFDEERYNIASACDELARRVPARIKSKPGSIPRSQVDFVDVAPQQPISVATSLIPFLEHDDGQRALMGSNMQRQAVPCICPQSPVVGTGQEARAAYDSGQVIVAQKAGTVKEVDAEHIKIDNHVYDLHNFIRSNADTSLNQRPLVNKGDKIKKGQVIADGVSTDQGELALGQNLLVAFMAWEGWNYEDAIVISQRLLKNNNYTSVHIEEFSIDVRDTKLGPEVTTRDIPNVGEEKLRNLDSDGVIHLGAEVRSRDILVGKISPKGEKDLTAEERLLRAIFGEKAADVKDASLLLPHGRRGKVVGVKIFSRDNGDRLPSGVIQTIKVSIAQLRNIAVGDKLAGRHGNKGVIAAILPEEDMPFLPDGRPVDIILNPLGVVSRMNIGQVLETHLGWAASTLGYKVSSPALNGITETQIKKELKKAGLPENGKIQLCDGRTGQKFDNKTTVGITYILKLHHLVEDKIHMRSTGPYSLITQQPLGGKAQFGGQRFGEMEVWALEGYGAAHSLQEILTIKSDDVVGRSRAYESIIKGESIKKPHVPASFHVLLQELKALGLNVTLK